MAIDTQGAARSWGYDRDGQLCDGSHGTDRPRPVAVDMPPERLWARASTGGVHPLALDVTGDAWACGRNDGGQLGTGSAGANVDAPVRVEMP